MPLPDCELMEKVKENNDTAAFEELVLRHRKAAVSFAVRYTKDYYLAEDLAQEAFARIYTQRERYYPGSKFTTYFFKVLRNICIDFCRKAKNGEEQREVAGEADSIFSSIDSPEEDFIKREKNTMVKNLLLSLKERYRTVLYLQEYEDLSYHEIAEVLNLTHGQVRMLIYRGRKKLRSLIEKEMKAL